MKRRLESQMLAELRVLEEVVKDNPRRIDRLEGWRVLMALERLETFIRVSCKNGRNTKKGA